MEKNEVVRGSTEKDGSGRSKCISASYLSGQMDHSSTSRGHAITFYYFTLHIQHTLQYKTKEK